MEKKTPQPQMPDLEIIELGERLDLAPDIFSVLSLRPLQCSDANSSCCNNNCGCL